LLSSARSDANSGGKEIPNGTAQAISGSSSGFALATAISSATEIGNAIAQPTSTGVCPRRSISLPRNGLKIADAIAWVAETAPAVAYEPLSWLTRRTIVSDTIATGNLPTNAAASSGRMPGSDSTAR
jgi:hypothetical protein